jgi:hypothetical protein
MEVIALAMVEAPIEELLVDFTTTQTKLTSQEIILGQTNAYMLIITH